MIRTFRHLGIRSLFLKGDSKHLDATYVKRIKILLDALDSAKAVHDMNFTGTHLHELKGNRKGTWSVRVSANWRLTFRFENGHAYDVSLEDYH